jgi:hypothetical protein
MTNIIGMSSWAGGLTTYLETLFYNNQHQIKSKKFFSCYIIPTDSEADSFYDYFLLPDLRIDPDYFLLPDRINSKKFNPRNPCPFYAYTLEFKANFFWSKPQQISFTIRDLPSEILKNIEEFLRDNHQYSGLFDSSLFFVDVQGYLLVMDGTSYRSDQHYADSIKKLLQSFPDRNNLTRIAFAMSKCELPQLWVNRDNPRGMAKNLFPKMYDILENWSDEENGQVEYFTTSAFGVLGKGEFLEPNSVILAREQWGTSAVIKNFNECQPFGLIEPLYWLSTGKHL